jgi:hypothetical protein
VNGFRLAATSLFDCGEGGLLIKLPGLSLVAMGLIVRFDFGFADCLGAGVELSSKIGGGDRCAIIKTDNETTKKRSRRLIA